MFGIIFLILFFPSFACAGELVLGLEEALKIAVSENHEIKSYENMVSARKEEAGLSETYRYPKIIFEERFTVTENPVYSFMSRLNQERFTQSDFAVDSLNNPDPVHDFQTSISFEQLLFGRAPRVGAEMSETAYRAKKEEFARKKEEVAYSVIQAYLMVSTAKEYMAAAENGVEDAREHARIAELNYQAGLGLYSDTLRALTALSGAEQRLTSAAKNLKVSKRRLGLILGMSEPVDISGSPVIPFNAAEPVDRKDLKALELNVQNAKNSIKLAESGNLPTVAAGGAYQMNTRNLFAREGESWQAFAVLRWELFDGYKKSYELGRARYQEAEIKEHLAGMRDAVAFRVYSAALDVEEAEKNAELAASAHRTAEEGKRLVKTRYENSVSPLIDLLDAQVSLDQARAMLVVRQNEYKSALAALGYESGTILKIYNLE